MMNAQEDLQREQLAENEWIKGLNENQARIKLNPMLLGKKKFHSKQLLMDDMIQSFIFGKFRFALLKQLSIF